MDLLCLVQYNDPTNGGSYASIFCILIFTGIGSAFIKRHNDIGPNLPLNIDGIFWGKYMIGTIDVGFKLYPSSLIFRFAEREYTW
jgi:hypothetical protein